MKNNEPQSARKALADLHGLRVRFDPPAAAASCACGLWASETGEHGAQSVVSAYEAHRATCGCRTGQTPRTAPNAPQTAAEQPGRPA